MQDTIPFGHCHCGCGQKTAISKTTCTKEGRVKGQPVRYIQFHYANPLRTIITDNGTLYCNRCKAFKPTEDFGKDKDTPLGYSRKCKECNRAYQVNRRAHAKEHCRTLHKKSHLKLYGCDLRKYESMLSKQDGKCAICRQPETNVRKGKIQDLSVDHDHTTGSMRGLLCANCNAALGMFRDDISVLESAIKYLKTYTSSV